MSSPFREALVALKNAISHLPGDEEKLDVTPDERFELLQSMDKLSYALESSKILRINMFFSTHHFTATIIARDMGVFEAFEENSWQDMTLNDLDVKTKGDKELLLRMMRILVCNHTFEETRRYKFRPGKLAKILGPSSPTHLAAGHFFRGIKTFAAMPDYFRENGWRMPSEAMHSPFQYAFNTNEHYFNWIAASPERQRGFNAAMKVNRTYQRQDWFDFYPVEERYSRTPPSGVALVDIGGGSGHDLIAFRQRFPTSNVPGRTILQELQSVLDDVSAPLPNGIEAMAYDMFTRQPIRGARAYYLRTVLHDWPDREAAQVLANIRKAMTPDSLLLINENTMPEDNVPRIRAQVDLTMMANFAALERTERQWTSLIESAGFLILEVWRPANEPSAYACLFEAVAMELSQL